MRPETDIYVGRRPRSAGPRPLLVLLFAIPLGVLVYWTFVQGISVRGRVVDAATTQAVVGATVAAPDAAAEANDSGWFALSPVRLGDPLAVSAQGYRTAHVRVGLSTQIDVRLEPRTLRLSVRDAETGQPISAEVRHGGRVAPSDGPDGYVLARIPEGAEIMVSAQGYGGMTMVYDGQDSAIVELQRIYRGRVVDAETGMPIEEARLVVDGELYPTAPDGEYRLRGRPGSGKAMIMAPGYRRTEVDLTRESGLEIKLEQFAARGVYLSFFGAGNNELQEHVLSLIDAGRLNSVVIDVKGDRGWIAYPSAVPLAGEIGANSLHTPGLDEFLEKLRARNVYLIARIVVFKDDLLGRYGPEAGVDVAIKNRSTGRPWIDGEGLAWVDPFQRATWDYNIALSVEAAQKGFEEIQFDYIRFPTDPSEENSMEDAEYARPFTEANRVEALAEFLGRAREELHEAGAYLSIDTFGYSAWFDGDLGIGHDLWALTPHVDYVSPMIYPSTYHAGLPASTPYPDVVEHPYEVVYQTIEQALGRMGDRHLKMRPWLQYFDDYPWATRMRYDAEQIAEQLRAVEDAGVSGWLFWDPTNTYARGGFAEPEMAAAP